MQKAGESEVSAHDNGRYDERREHVAAGPPQQAKHGAEEGPDNREPTKGARRRRCTSPGHRQETGRFPPTSRPHPQLPGRGGSARGSSRTRPAMTSTTCSATSARRKLTLPSASTKGPAGLGLGVHPPSDLVAHQHRRRRPRAECGDQRFELDGEVPMTGHPGADGVDKRRARAGDEHTGQVPAESNLHRAPIRRSPVPVGGDAGHEVRVVTSEVSRGRNISDRHQGNPWLKRARDDPFGNLGFAGSSASKHERDHLRRLSSSTATLRLALTRALVAALGTPLRCPGPIP